MTIIKECMFLFLDKKAVGITKQNAIKLFSRKFKITPERATIYYDEWRYSWVRRGQGG